MVMSLGKKIKFLHSREKHSEGTVLDAFPDPGRPSYYFLSVEGYEGSRFSLVCWEQERREILRSKKPNQEV